tara:strand:- start:1535 stop:1717 length:183 start_codon:yes stop_codon:yes gene_type:complete
MHLSTNNRIGAMVFYSLLTFFIIPMITTPYFKDHQDPCIGGFVLGFALSILLWMKFGKDL